MALSHSNPIANAARGRLRSSTSRTLAPRNSTREPRASRCVVRARPGPTRVVVISVTRGCLEPCRAISGTKQSTIRPEPFRAHRRAAGRPPRERGRGSVPWGSRPARSGLGRRWTSFPWCVTALDGARHSSRSTASSDTTSARVSCRGCGRLTTDPHLLSPPLPSAGVALDGAQAGCRSRGFGAQRHRVRGRAGPDGRQALLVAARASGERTPASLRRGRHASGVLARTSRQSRPRARVAERRSDLPPRVSPCTSWRIPSPPARAAWTRMPRSAILARRTNLIHLVPSAAAPSASPPRPRPPPRQEYPPPARWSTPSPPVPR